MVFLVYLKSRGGRTTAQGPDPSLQLCFCTTLQLRMAFTSLKGCKQTNKDKKEYVTVYVAHKA